MIYYIIGQNVDDNKESLRPCCNRRGLCGEDCVAVARAGGGTGYSNYWMGSSVSGDRLEQGRAQQGGVYCCGVGLVEYLQVGPPSVQSRGIVTLIAPTCMYVCRSIFQKTGKNKNKPKFPSGGGGGGVGVGWWQCSSVPIW